MKEMKMGKDIFKRIQSVRIDLYDAYRLVMGVVYLVVLLHLIDYGLPFMFDWIDWILYVFTIIILSIASFWKLNDYAETVANYKVRKCFRFILAVESLLFVMELFRDYIIFFGNIWHIAEITKLIFTFMIFPALIIKYVKEDAKNNKHVEIADSLKKQLKITRYFLAAVITFAVIYYIIPEYTILIALLVFAFLGWRTYILMVICAAGNYQIEYYEINDTEEDAVEQNIAENTKSAAHSKVKQFVKKIVKTLGVVVIVLVIIVGVASNYYVKDHEKEYGFNSYGDWNKDNIEAYNETYFYCEYKNLMPYWTRLDKSYGNIVDSAGTVKASHIKNSIYIADDYGLLPDGKGHMIDVTGEYQYDLPYLCNANISQRTIVYRSFLAYLNNLKNRIYWSCGDNTTYKDYYYAYEPYYTVGKTNENGAVIFYSRVKGKYGVCDKNGTVLNPEYKSIKNKGRIYRIKDQFYGKNGEPLLTDYDVRWDIDENYYCGLFLIEYDLPEEMALTYETERYLILDYDGNIIVDDIDSIISDDEFGIVFSKNGTKYIVGSDYVVWDANKYRNIKHISLSDLYDYEDDESLKKRYVGRR